MKKTLVLFLASVLAMSSIQLNAQNVNDNEKSSQPISVEDENVELKSNRDIQVPPGFFNYQAALRNASGLILAEEEVEVVVEILEGDVTGAVVYTQTETVTTTAQGLINLKIGDGLHDINWNFNSYFIRLTVDATEMGTSELLTVPYAMHSKIATYAVYADIAENVQWGENGNTAFALQDEVAIGSESASAQLHVSRENSATNSQIYVTQYGTGDAAIGIDIGGNYNYSIGIDQSDDNKLKISSTWSPSLGEESITITTDDKVGIGTSNPTAQLHVQGGMKVGETGVEIGDIIELTGTTSASLSYASMTWPAGFDKTNSRVLSVGIQRDESVDGYKSLGYTIDGVVGSIYVSLSSNVWLYYPDDATMKDQNYRITLMRVQ